MITEWLISVGVLVGDWFVSLFPADDAPSWWVDFDGLVNTVLSQLNGVSVWVDWGYVIAVVGVVLAVWLASFIVKIVRAIAAHIPLFGGAG